MALLAKLYPQAAPGRRDERHRAAIGATMRDASLSPRDITISDLSSSGFCADLTTLQEPGEQLRVGISGIGVREARVVWRDGIRHGCEFLTALDEASVRVALDADTVVLGDFGVLPAAGRRPLDDRYPGWVRLSLVIALPLALWSGLIWTGARLMAD